MRAGTTRYLGASAACQKNASQFLLKAGGEGGKKQPSAARSTGKRTGSGPSPRALMPPPAPKGAAQPAAAGGAEEGEGGAAAAAAVGAARMGAGDR